VLHNIASQYTTNDEVAELHPVLDSREATPSSGKEVSSDITVHDAEEGAKGDKKRRK
jgi:hypothetical protein